MVEVDLVDVKDVDSLVIITDPGNLGYLYIITI